MVLSSGTAVFTSDRRFHMQTFPDTWVLKIDPVLEKDDGFYECQVNTRDTMSLVFKLNVERKSNESFRSYLSTILTYNSHFNSHFLFMN